MDELEKPTLYGEAAAAYLTTTVNVGLVDAMKAGKAGDREIAAAADALGVQPR